MRLLLDTHLVLWWLENSKALGAMARSLIADPGNTIFVSAVTHWEVRLKQSLGKLKLTGDFKAVMAAEAFENLPLSAAHTALIEHLPWHHRDPFSRMLVAQAKAENLILLTADNRLAAYGAWVKLVR